MGFDVSTINNNPDVGNSSQTATAPLALATSPSALSLAPLLAEKSYVSIRQALLVLFFRRRLILAVAGAVVFITALAVLIIPPRFHSEAKLLVRLGRESVVLDPSARIGEAAVPMEGRDKEINSEIELLKSRMLTEQIVSSLGATASSGVRRGRRHPKKTPPPPSPRSRTSSAWKRFRTATCWRSATIRPTRSFHAT